MALADKPLPLTLSTTGEATTSRSSSIETSAASRLQGRDNRNPHAVAESFPNTANLGESSVVGAELQVLLAEVKRLSMYQEQLKQEVKDIYILEAQNGSATANKHRAVPKLNSCKMADCPKPVLTVPFGRQYTAGSSDWSESATETPVKNVISGTQCASCHGACIKFLSVRTFQSMAYLFVHMIYASRQHGAYMAV